MKQNTRKAASGIRHPFLNEALHAPSVTQHLLAQALARASRFHVPQCQGRTAQQRTRLKNSNADNVGISPSVAFISECEQALNPNGELNGLQQALCSTVRLQIATEGSCALCTAQSQQGAELCSGKCTQGLACTESKGCLHWLQKCSFQQEMGPPTQSPHAPFDGCTTD